MLRDAVTKISSEFTRAIEEPYVKHPLADFIRDKAPKIITEALPEKFKHYKIKGSSGLQDWAFSSGAWLGIFNPEITEGARQGYYLVYGFPAGTTEFIFGLGQGYTEAQSTYKSKWEEALERTAELMRLKVSLPFSKGFNTTQAKFDLDKNSKDRGYRVGYAFHKIYNSLALPSEQEMLNDLSQMLHAYEEIYSNGGRNLDFISTKKIKKKKKEYEDDEEDYQNPPQKKKLKTSPKSNELTAKEKSQIKTTTSSVRPREPGYGEEAKQLAEYKCEISSQHETFIRKTDGNPYTEAHHLIPYSQYDYYADKKDLCIDRAVNIISLCPNCHRKIHHGNINEIHDLIETIYDKRGKKLFEAYGCDLETLKSYY